MEENMAKKDNEYAFADSIGKLAGILTEVAVKLDDFAESLEASDGEIEELNAGKTQEEIEREDALAVQIASPLVNALDGISGILNNATAKVMEMAVDLFNGEAQGA
jgi:hypothetical protein